MFFWGVIAFCGFSTGAVFALHIDYCCGHDSNDSHDGPSPQKHDGSKCPICLVLQGHTGKFIVGPAIEHISTVEFNPGIIFLQNSFPSSFQREPFVPRGPPLFAQRQHKDLFFGKVNLSELYTLKGIKFPRVGFPARRDKGSCPRANGKIQLGAL